MAATSTVTVRMYHVGFGDAFLVTVKRGSKRWRMLVDCGVHPSGVVHSLDSVVPVILADLADKSEAEVDLVVATHRHDDHIAGFADDRWESVSVGAVWLPWAESPTDPEALELQRETEAVAAQLTAFAGAALDPLEELAVDRKIWRTIGLLAANAQPKEKALPRLRGETDGFVDPAAVRYVSNDGEDETVVETPFPDVKVHVLGPSRNPAVLKRMDPPKANEWPKELTAIAAYGPQATGRPLFDPSYELPPDLLKSQKEFESLRSHQDLVDRLHQVGDQDALLAASKLESWCNNTSVFVVLEVGKRRLVFPGDCQEGGWRHILERQHTRELVAGADFYKVSHHGSHNGSPQRFIDELLGDDRSLMLPFSPVKQWEKIPVKGLIAAFDNHHHHVACTTKDYRKNSAAIVDQNGMWSEVTV